MEKLSKYFKVNIIEGIGNPNPSNILDNKYVALRFGLLNYYETYQAMKKFIISNYFYQVNNHIEKTEFYSYNFTVKYFSSISFIHLFFEHFIVEILSKINPVLPKLKEIDIINVIQNNWMNIDVSKKRNIDYSLALKRIEDLIVNHENIPLILRIDEKYHFLKLHIKTLIDLAELRNDIIHNGQNHLNLYSYEILFINGILPLIREILNLNEKVEFIERSIFCKLNIIDELINRKLPEEITIKNSDKIGKELQYINHLKELGRASYDIPLYMGLDKLDENQKNIYQTHINDPAQRNAMIEASLKQQYLNYFEILTCPCCGTKSLLTYEVWTILATNRKRVQSAKCVLCPYDIWVDLEEPKDFGITTEIIFKYLD